MGSYGERHRILQNRVHPLFVLLHELGIVNGLIVFRRVTYTFNAPTKRYLIYM